MKIGFNAVADFGFGFATLMLSGTAFAGNPTPEIDPPPGAWQLLASASFR